MRATRRTTTTATVTYADVVECPAATSGGHGTATGCQRTSWKAPLPKEHRRVGRAVRQAHVVHGRGHEAGAPPSQPAGRWRHSCIPLFNLNKPKTHHLEHAVIVFPFLLRRSLFGFTSAQQSSHLNSVQVDLDARVGLMRSVDSYKNGGSLSEHEFDLVNASVFSEFCQVTLDNQREDYG